MNLALKAGFVTIGSESSADLQDQEEDEEKEVKEKEKEEEEEDEEEEEASDAALNAGEGADEAGETAGATQAAVRASDPFSRAESVDFDDDEDEDIVRESSLTQSIEWSPQTESHESVNELHDYFAHFYSTRMIVKEAFHLIKKACSDIQELLATGDADQSDIWISGSEQDTIISALATDPLIMVLGCKGSGKSGLINCIVGQEILPSSATMLRHAANGIVHLRYDAEGYVKLQKSERVTRLDCGEQSQKLCLQVREFVESGMTDDERTAWAALDDCVLEVGANNPVLRTRVQFLEVPGDCFDPRIRQRLLRQMVKSTFQTVVYVIDGNKGLGNSDRELLFFLKASIPNLRVFYIINKVDYDPEAEEMDCESEESEDSDDGERFHSSGRETQQRKRRLVESQLQQYHLTGGNAVFPVSILRQKFPLEGSSPAIAAQNLQYREEFQRALSALKKSLVEASEAAASLMISTLFLVAIRTFDAFTRDASNDSSALQAEQTSKERIKQSFRQTAEKFNEVKRNFYEELVQTHKQKRQSIIDECQKLEFGPLRLYTKIRNNEVEQQYRDQINNFVLHLLNVSIQERLEQEMQQVRQKLNTEVERLKEMFCDSSKNQPSSPWEDLIRSHADDIVGGIVRLNFSVEWKAESGFFRWVKKMLNSKKPSARSRTAAPNTEEWKREAALEFYESIDLSAVVKKVFAGVDCMLKRAEQSLLNLVNSRCKHAEKLQKLLVKENQQARGVWLNVQLCLATAEALRNMQAHKPLQVARLAKDGCHTSLGHQRHLVQEYALFQPTSQSGIACTVTRLWATKVNHHALHEWTAGLGGLLNHHLIKSAAILQSRSVAVTLMLSFTDRYELCALHSAYDTALEDAIEGTGEGRYTKLQAFSTMRSLMDVWQLHRAQKDQTKWSIRLAKLKTKLSMHEIVYDNLETPVELLKKGHMLSRLLKPDEVVRRERCEHELNRTLEIFFMLLVRRVCPFVDSQEFELVNEIETSVEARHQRLTHLLKAKSISVAAEDRIDRLPYVAVANLWFAPQQLKVEQINDFIQRGLEGAKRDR